MKTRVLLLCWSQWFLLIEEDLIKTNRNSWNDPEGSCDVIKWKHFNLLADGKYIHTAATLPFGTISQSSSLIPSLYLSLSPPLPLSSFKGPRISLCQISPPQKGLSWIPKLRYYYLSRIDHLSRVLRRFIPWRNEPTKDTHSSEG